MTQHYIPALRYRALTALYDPVVRFTTREHAFKTALLEQARLQPGHQVLDLACGTATLTIAAKQMQPQAEFICIDADPQILERANRKAAKAGVSLRFEQAMSLDLPFPEGRFDVVFSSLFFHHLGREAKLATLKEAHRVLRPGGMLHVADWGKAANPFMRIAFLAVQLLDGFRTTADNVAGRLPELMRNGGFEDVKEMRRYSTMFGTLCLYRARKPRKLPHPESLP